MGKLKEFKDFYGIVDVPNYMHACRGLSSLAVEIHHKLGSEGYLLETYLGNFLSAILPLYQGPTGVGPTGDAFDELKDCIARICNKQACEILFYEEAKNYIKSHPLAGLSQETQIYVYAAALFDHYLDYRSRERRAFYREQLRTRINTRDLEALRDRITEIIGIDYMEPLRMLLQQVFCCVTPMERFMQDEAVALMGYLLTRDEESGRTVLRLRLENAEKKKDTKESS